MLAAVWIETPWEAAVAVALIAVGGWVFHGRPVKAAVGKVAVEVGAMRETVEAIDHAVNQRAAGAPTVSDDSARCRQLAEQTAGLAQETVERVAAIEARLVSGDAVFASLHAALGQVGDRLAAIEDAVTSPGDPPS